MNLTNYFPSIVNTYIEELSAFLRSSTVNVVGHNQINNVTNYVEHHYHLIPGISAGELQYR
jgi:hypothetical protein